MYMSQHETAYHKHKILAELLSILDEWRSEVKGHYGAIPADQLYQIVKQRIEKEQGK